MSTLSPGVQNSPGSVVLSSVNIKNTPSQSMTTTDNRQTAVAVARKSTAPSWDQICKSLVAGGVAGGLSRTAVAPLERLKILMQVQGNDRIYKGVWQGLVHMCKTEGMRGMMKGNWTNCVRIIPNSAMKFFTYEQLTRC
ncbi:mitochondrial carrier protein-domain-containing protein [Scenedesmus sp. NREL 46B-D3]|nr:mitochondrial carrier protein-domain-containing protein [Scenedesmus sp. NREL 46B-D3]